MIIQKTCSSFTTALFCLQLNLIFTDNEIINCSPNHDLHLHICTCVYAYICMCLCICVYVCTYISVYVLYVCIFICFRDIPKACIAFCHIVVYYKCCTVTLFFAPYFDNFILTMTLTMTMKIILLPCNTCGVHSDNMTLTSYIQQSVI